jgi:hypothetical protein
MTATSTSLCLTASLLAVLAVNACSPTAGSVANPQVKGDHSTIQGDSAATIDRRMQ